MSNTIIDRLSPIQLEAILDADHGELRVMSDLLGVNYDSLRGALSRHKARTRNGEQPLVEPVESPHLTEQIPENVILLEEADKPLHLEFDRWLYASDWHIPLHSRPMVERLVRVAQQHKVRTLVIGGDFFDYDMLSRFPKEQRQSELGKTHKIAGQMVRFLGQVFDTLILMPGNHDRRVARLTGQPWSMDELLGAALGLADRPKCEIITTSNDYVFIGPDGNQGWVVGHPRFFSSIPAKGMGEVAEKVGRNTIGSHNHLQGMMRSRSGRYLSIDPGCMCEAELTPYHLVSDGLSRFPSWIKGFVLIEDNRPTLFDDGRLVDWSKYVA